MGWFRAQSDALKATGSGHVLCAGRLDGSEYVVVGASTGGRRDGGGGLGPT
jgi:hypothetical protein